MRLQCLFGVVGVRCAVCLAIASGVHAASAQTQTLKFYGYAYDLDSGKYAYTEVFDVRVEGGRWRQGTTRYVAADGTELGRRSFDFSADPYVPIFTTQQNRSGYSEGVTRVTGSGVDLFTESRDGGRRTATVPHAQPMAADCGFHPLLIDKLDALAAGRVVSFQFAVAGKLDSFSFRARKVADVQIDGRPALRIAGEPDSLLRWLVAPLSLTYDREERRLLEYRGPSNIFNPQTGQAYNVRIVYPKKPPDDTPSPLPPLE